MLFQKIKFPLVHLFNTVIIPLVVIFMFLMAVGLKFGGLNQFDNIKILFILKWGNYIEFPYNLFFKVIVLFNLIIISSIF